MHTGVQTGREPKAMLWAGRIITALIGLFMLFDAGIKVLKLTPAVEGTVRLGYAESAVVGIGVAELVSVVLYLVPRTAVLGAILLTGYFGGATATHVRMSDPWFAFPVFFGVLTWAGIYLRDRRVRELIPLRS